MLKAALRTPLPQRGAQSDTPPVTDQGHLSLSDREDLGQQWADWTSDFTTDPAPGTFPPTNSYRSDAFFFFSHFFLGLHLRHMEVPTLGVELGLQVPAYATATATPDPSRICDLRRSLRQRQILNPLSEARNPTRILIDISWVLNPLSHNSNS